MTRNGQEDSRAEDQEIEESTRKAVAVEERERGEI